MADFDVVPGAFRHVLAVLVLIARLGDIGSTWLITPRLHLEANEVMRRLGWPFAVSTLLLALVPYVDARAGVALLAMSLLVSTSNLLRGWIANALGEEEYRLVLLRAARAGSRRRALAFVLAAAAFAALSGVVVMWLSHPSAPGAYWFGAGMLLYAVAIAVHGSTFIDRVFQDAT